MKIVSHLISKIFQPVVYKEVRNGPCHKTGYRYYSQIIPLTIANPAKPTMPLKL